MEQSIFVDYYEYNLILMLNIEEDISVNIHENNNDDRITSFVNVFL